MNKIKLLFLLAVVAVALPSCMSTYFQTVMLGKGLENAMRAVDTLHNREVILLGMPHAERKEYYDTLSRFLVARGEEGYSILMEGVGEYDSVADGKYDSLKLDTIARKMRFVIGFSLGSYADKENKSLPEAYANTNNLLSPTYELLGFNRFNGEVVAADMTRTQIVKLFEQRYAPIPLTDYDFQTPLKAKYDRPHTDGFDYGIFDLASASREMLLIDQVIVKKNPKLIIMYGHAHLHSILSRLRAIGYDDYQLHYLKNGKSKQRQEKSKTKK